MTVGLIIYVLLGTLMVGALLCGMARLIFEKSGR